LDWGPDGLYLLALKRAASHLFRADPESGAVVQLTPDDPPGWAITEGWIGLGCNFTQSFSHTAFVNYDMDHYNEVTVLDTTRGNICRLSDATAEIRGWSLGQSELFQWNAPDGVPIEGILTKPPGFEPGKRHPLVVVTHGGPTYTSLLPPLSDGDHWYCAIPQLVNQGALILQPNYRGSTGYGEAFRALNVGTLGLSEYADVVSGVDALIERGWVDPERVGVIGMSHGGYLAAFLATYTDRFRAAVMLSGISDWVLNYCRTDTGGWMRQYLRATPWEDPDIYRATSPLAYIQQAKTPVLIQHGEADDRAPVANAYALYRGLKDVGVEAKMILYPGMGHGISQPRQFRRLMREVVGWFGYWLWEEQK
jgi:dipeptidyl aminopeptidase/acylaminoacyl peptidase